MALHTHVGQLYRTILLNQSRRNREDCTWPGVSTMLTSIRLVLPALYNWVVPGQKLQRAVLDWLQGGARCIMAPQPKMKFRLIHTCFPFIPLGGDKIPLNSSAKIFFIILLMFEFYRHTGIIFVVWTTDYNMSHCNQLKTSLEFSSNDLCGYFNNQFNFKHYSCFWQPHYLNQNCIREC